MFDIFYSGSKPNLFAHEQPARDIVHAAQLSRTRYFWWINYLTDYTGFDFLFEPVPWQAEFRHAWPSQWQPDSGTYLIPKKGYKDTHYHQDKELIRRNDYDNWSEIVDNFDYSWHPDPADPPLTYHFGTQWQKTGGPIYRVPGATEKKYVETPRIERKDIGPFWNDLNYEGFDYTWHPDATDPPLRYQFGTQWQKTGGPVYSVPGATETKYVRTPFYFRKDVDDNWEIPNNVSVESFDFTWHPDATDPPYCYQFGTQHQRTGGPRYLIAGATETKYIDQIKIKTERVATAIVEIDHLDGNAGQIANTTRTVRYFDNYLDTLKRIANNIGDEHEFIWICSSICDYSAFDFSWHPEQWQAGMLHVFPSNEMKFGDTFFMHVPTFRYRADKCQLLDWYDVNYTEHSVPRRPLPVVHHAHDTHVEAVKTTDWAGPLAVFTINKHVETVPTVSLWREKTKTVVPLSVGASQVVVPKTAVPYIRTQCYDYPYIDRTHRQMYWESPLDIVFIDNGEPNAEYNYLQLPHVSTPNKIHRSSGVDGRVAAYHRAAELSTTPWFFAVFAKLRVRDDFNWDWQPDRLQEPKHYIFHAFNPINGLTYGHQAMIAYNKKLVLANPGVGLDFTLDSAHEVVPIVSGTAEYAHSPWMAWRTAFRECLKLRASADVESKYRLDKWLSVAMGQPYGQYSIYGAEDAVEYYDSVGGDFAELKKSYDWSWLATYAMIKRNLQQNQ